MGLQKLFHGCILHDQRSFCWPNVIKAKNIRKRPMRCPFLITLKDVNKINAACLAFDVILSGDFSEAKLVPLLYNHS